MKSNKKLAFNPYLPGYEYIPDGEPYIYEEIYGTKEEERNQYIANITSGIKIGFKYFLFNKKIKKIILSLRGNAEGKIRIHIDSFDGASIGERKISVNNDQWSDIEVPVKIGLKGTHGIFIDYSGDGCIEFNSFTFE